MPGIFDALTALLGQSDPRQQLAARLNPIGGPGGAPIPPGTAPGPGGGGAGPPAAPSSAAGAPPGVGGPPPPTPTAYQSPPDLLAANAKLANPNAPSPDAQAVSAQAPQAPLGPMPGAPTTQITPEMFLQMQNQEWRRQDFNRGLAMMAAGLHPGRVNPAMMKAIMGEQHDPGETMQAVMALQGYQRQTATNQALWESIPQLSEKMNIPQETLKAAFAAGKLPDVIAVQAGVGGGPAWMAQQRAERAYDARGEVLPWVRGDPTSYDAYTKAKTATTVADQTTADKEKLAAKTEFPSVDAQHQAVEDNIAWLNDPAHRDAVVAAVQKPDWLTSGQTGRWAGYVPGSGVTQDILDAKTKLELLSNQLYSSSFTGKNQRLAAVEAQRLREAYTNLKPGLSAQGISDELGRLQAQSMRSRANIYASAGKVIPSKYAGLADPEYLDPNSLLYNKATEEKPSDQTPKVGGGVTHVWTPEKGLRAVGQ